MSSKTKISLAFISLMISFAAGRYSVDEPAVTTIEDRDEHTEIDRDTRRTETIVREVDGRETRTIVEEDRSRERSDSSTRSEVKVEPVKVNTLNISALIGTDINHYDRGFIYGASVTKQVLGPISAGAWGLTNGTIGISIGVSF